MKAISAPGRSRESAGAPHERRKKTSPLPIDERTARKNPPKKESAKQALEKASKLSVRATMPMRKWKW